MDVGEEKTGRLIAGRYRIHQLIGQGGMGLVWMAYDENLDRKVAVKEMLVESADAIAQGDFLEDLETRRERFLREVKMTAKVEHPGVPAVYDAGVDPESGRLYVAMQLIKGRQLRTLLDETDHRADPLPVSFAAAMGAQIAAVLHEVGKHDIVHRDIKPENLMLTPGGLVKVLDFGVAALLGSGDTLRLTKAGMTVGTPPYMSPEQTLANTLGPDSDVYSLACVIYELLTGRPPFVETVNRSHLWHHVHSQPPSLLGLRPDVPEEMAELLLGMLAKSAAARPDAGEVYERLLPAARRNDGDELTDLGDLDCRLPFTRPLGGAVRRPQKGKPRRTAGPSISEQEIEEIVALADELLKEQRSTQAIDLLADALSRTTDQDLEIHLTFSLAHASFIGGRYTEAAELFTTVAKHFGPGDEDTQIAQYYIGQCKAELGDVAGAIEAFRTVAAGQEEGLDAQGKERVLDAVAFLVRLYAASGRRDLFERSAAELRSRTQRYHPASATELADVDAYVDRLTQYLDEAQPD
ncbi:serine/threonine-protein kinase [Actinocorallia lasiicapitis]